MGLSMGGRALTGNSLRFGLPLIGVFTLLLASCAPTRVPDGSGVPQSAPRQVKTLRIGTTKEPTTGIILFNGGGTGQQLGFIFCRIFHGEASASPFCFPFPMGAGHTSPGSPTHRSPTSGSPARFPAARAT